MKISQGNCDDRLVKELIKIGTTIVYPYGHDWRHKEEAGKGH